MNETTEILVMVLLLLAVCVAGMVVRRVSSWIERGGEPFDRFFKVLDRILSVWGGPKSGA